SFLHDHAAPATYTLSLHDALPIYERLGALDLAPQLIRVGAVKLAGRTERKQAHARLLEAPAHRLTAFGVKLRLDAVRVLRSELQDRKSTRLNSSHVKISYAVFCLK